MSVYLADSDLTVYCADALDVLRRLPDGSVDCCVTSPPYWGLRDYGTGEWEGGSVRGCELHDPTYFHAGGAKDDPLGTEYPPCSECCEHRVGNQVHDNKAKGAIVAGVRPGVDASTCLDCGARRVDRQIGLEATPDEFVQAMVAVFREVRRVLAPHGTCWVNLGDSYATTPPGRGIPGETSGLHGFHTSERYRETLARGHATKRNTVVGGLKPKDLVGIPWRVAFALQADGWWLRSDIVWAKPNPMPESVTDRPTKSHEYLFLLTRAPRYFFDQEAVREPFDQSQVRAIATVLSGGTLGELPPEAPRGPDGRRKTAVQGGDGSIQHRDGERWPNGGRNVRSVWTIATQPYPEAHFATFPEELPRRAIAAGCPLAVCRVCGKPRERIVEASYDNPGNRSTNGPRSTERHHETAGFEQRLERRSETVGWSDCGHNDYRPGRVLDPFAGAGTTLLVARKLGRHSIGIELSPEYAELIAKRTQQLSLLGEAASG